ncbi:MAG: hypothetical protein QY310_06515 [Candidatus Jettenia sp. CY-1]|nr:MAG: hypothetical protein QY310_06515 [Candidatus Jettenia sp. CY-1]
MDNQLIDSLKKIKSYIKQGNAIIDTCRITYDLIGNVSRLIKHTKRDVPDDDVLDEFLNNLSHPRRIKQKREDIEDQLRTIITESSIVARGNPASIANIAQKVFSNNLSLLSGLSVSIVSSLVDGYLTRRTIKEGFESVNKTLRYGFDGVISNMVNGFERLDATFNWGFSELIWRIDQQTSIAEDIRKALTEPLTTQSRELRKRGIEAYNYGWFDVALKDLHEAMEKVRIDFVVVQYIGNIYLFHEQDYDKAIFYYGEAARFSDPKSIPHYVFALFHQALAYYLARHKSKIDDYRSACSCLQKAVDKMPENLELRYQLAQYCVLAERKEDGLKELDVVLRSDPRYLLKVILEPDFDSAKIDIERLIASLVEDLGRKVRERMVPHLEIIREIESPPKLRIYNYVYISHDVSKIPKSKGSVDYRAIKEDSESFLQPDYQNNRNIIDYIKKFQNVAELYANGDLISLHAALDAINLLPLPKKIKDSVVITLYTDNGSRPFFSHQSTFIITELVGICCENSLVTMDKTSDIAGKLLTMQIVSFVMDLIYRDCKKTSSTHCFIHR